MKSGDDVASEPLKRPWMVKRQMRWWIAAALVLAAGVVISQMIPARGGAADAQDGEWMTAMAQPVQHRLILQGQLLPKHSVDIVAPTEGTLTSLDVSWGDKVAAGQRLALIRSTDLTTQLREAEAAALRTRIEAEIQRVPERSSKFRAAVRRVRDAAHDAHVAASRAADTQTLYDKGIVSRMELEQARHEADSAQGQAEEAREDLKQVVVGH